MKLKIRKLLKLNEIIFFKFFVSYKVKNATKN